MRATGTGHGVVPGAPGVPALALAAALAAGGCAGLDERLGFPEPMRAAPAAPAAPQVVGARGPLPARQARAVVERLADEGPGSLVERHLATMEALGGPPLVVGNAARLLVDGPQTHGAMFEAIAAARRHVHLETYILEGGETGERLASLLAERVRHGVRVALLYDSVGGLRTPREYFERLRAAGVAVCEFNPVAPLAGGVLTLNHRDHRKILVVDGRVAFTGGINISDVYSSGSASASRRADRGDGWRDTHVEARGPVVAEFQRLFLGTWADQHCPPGADVDGAFPPPARAGDRVMRVVASTPRDARNAIRDELLSAMAHAERSIHVTMAYFVPDPTALDVLEAAARRGVDVRLVLPGFSDFWAVHAAGRSHYGRLLAAGVRIHERRDALLHAKTVVVDGVWSTVGSANMDWRSFLHNDEVNLIVIGEGFGREMERLFDEDLARSVPIDAASWSRRGPLERMREGLARLLEYWL